MLPIHSPRNSRVLIVITILLLVFGVAAFAQDYNPRRYPIITPDNAVDLREIVTLTTEQITEVAFSPDGSILAVASGVGVWFYDALNLNGAPQLVVKTNALVNAIAFSPDGRLLAFDGADHVVWLVHVASGEMLPPLIGHTNQINDLAFSPDGTMLASGSLDGTLRLWDVKQTVEVARLTDDEATTVWTVAFSPDGSWLASVIADTHTVIRLWDIETLIELPVPMTGYQDSPHNALFSPDGDFLVSSSFYGVIWFRDMTGRNSHIFGSGHTELVGDVAFNPDGTLLASAAHDGTVIVWDVVKQLGLVTLSDRMGKAVTNIAFSPNGTLVAVASYGTVRLWAVTE